MRDYKDMSDTIVISKAEFDRLLEIEHDTAGYRGFCPNDGSTLVDWKRNWPKKICEKCQYTYDPGF